MKSIKTLLLVSVISSLLLSSCATIVGGSKYWAQVVVANNPRAKIYYQGQEIGTGSADVLIKRAAANHVVFEVKQDGLPDKRFEFYNRTFRGFSFAGTILSWGLYGIILDLATGSVWKPDIEEKGISKIDFKDYKYVLNISNNEPIPIKIQGDFIDKIYLKNGGIIKGRIIENIPDVQIKILTLEGKTIIYKMEEIDSWKRFPLE